MLTYRVPRGVKRPDIVKEFLMFALWSLESKMFGKWSEIYSLDVKKFKLNNFFDRLNVQVFCKNRFFF